MEMNLFIEMDYSKMLAITIANFKCRVADFKEYLKLWVILQIGWVEIDNMSKTLDFLSHLAQIIWQMGFSPK